MVKCKNMDKQMQHSTTAASEKHLNCFIETARAIGCDESEEAFAKKLKAIASVKQKPKKAKKK